MNGTKTCKCGRAKRSIRPACKRCWRDYLNGASPACYVPQEDGLLAPRESTPEWEREQLRHAAAKGRPNPFKGGS